MQPNETAGRDRSLAHVRYRNDKIVAGSNRTPPTYNDITNISSRTPWMPTGTDMLLITEMVDTTANSVISHAHPKTARYATTLFQV